MKNKSVKKTVSEKPRFFKAEQHLRSWFLKSSDPLWIGMFKKGTSDTALTSAVVHKQAMCCGWTGVKLRGIDAVTFKGYFTPRRKKSVWSFKSIQAFKDLKKQGLITQRGERAFNERDRIKSEEKPAEFTNKQLKEFKANKIAWDFFESQTASYQKYMKYWVNSAVRDETQTKRLNELIQDSAEGTKLKRILAMIEKMKPKYEPGQTPIEAAKNIGPVLGSELRSIGIDTVEKLKKFGWEKVAMRLLEMYPARLNYNAISSIVGAAEEVDQYEIDPDLKAEAKSLIAELKRSRW